MITNLLHAATGVAIVLLVVAAAVAAIFVVFTAISLAATAVGYVFSALPLLVPLALVGGMAAAARLRCG
jgi:hypothetical protein